MQDYQKLIDEIDRTALASETGFDVAANKELDLINKDFVTI